MKDTRYTVIASKAKQSANMKDIKILPIRNYSIIFTENISL